MLAKKVTALLVSAALVLTLLAGCGNGSKALSQVMADLLSGLYTNVDVEVDSDLTAALKKAAAEGGTEEEILTRLVNNLNLSGVSISFNRLDDGQQGEHGVDLVFQAGSDPDAAARNALAQWAGIFGSLPDDGSYRASVAMIEAENGYYIAVDVEVLKAGSTSSDNDPGPTDPGFSCDDYAIAQDGTYTVYTEKGLLAWAEAAQNALDSGKTDVNCTLGADETIQLTGTWVPIGGDGKAYNGIFEGNSCVIKGMTVAGTSEYQGMFGFLGENAQIRNLTLEQASVTTTGDSVQHSGIVAGYSNGLIQDCTVSGTVNAPQYVGGVVGTNSSNGVVQGCVSTAMVTGSGIRTGGVVGSNDGIVKDCRFNAGTVKGAGQVGGIAGYNGKEITSCIFTGSVKATGEKSGGIAGSNVGKVANCASTGSVTSEGNAVGGVVGESGNDAIIIGCRHAEGLVKGNSVVGGVVGTNRGQTTACYSTSDVEGNTWVVGGAVGSNFGTLKACYWSGSASKGVANNQGSGDAVEVGENGVTWITAVEAMNSECGDLYNETTEDTPPTLKIENNT